MEFPAYIESKWWIKWYAPLVITEEGIYIQNYVPEDYGGPKLNVQVVQRVILSTVQGYLQHQRFDDMSMVMGKDKKYGVGTKFPAFGTLFPEETTQAGPSGTTCVMVMEENGFFASRRARMMALVEASLVNRL